VTSNIFGAVFARMGSANWITETMLALQVSPVLMLIVVLMLIFLLGWPFEWPAIVLVFLPIFYPVMSELKPALGASLNISPDMVMVWFGALVAVVLQTAFLSPPVAMSAYYLRQVVKDWSLANIYHGMFQFMILQVIAIAMIVAFPGIATWFPERLQAQSRAIVTEEVDGAVGLDAYQTEGGYGEELRDALQDSREQDAQEAQEDEEEEEGAGGSQQK
jgi:TRAP-type mannitol/chloroaromatic compound transport system permease large subunit